MDPITNMDDKKREESYEPDIERDSVSIAKGDLLSQEHVDPVLNAKMHLVNDVRLPISPSMGTRNLKAAGN